MQSPLVRENKIESDLFRVNYALKDLQKPATIEIPLKLPCFVKSPGQGMSIKLVPVIMSSDLKGSIRGTCEIGDSGRSFNIAAAGGHGAPRLVLQKDPSEGSIRRSLMIIASISR